MRVGIITVSDSVSRDGDPDHAGVEIEAVLRAGLPEVEIERRAVSEEPHAVRGALEDSADCEFVLTTGGVGIAEHEIVPEVTEAYCDRLLPGVAEALRAASMHETPLAMLIRSVAGIKGATIIVNLPESVQHLRVAARALLPIMRHTPAMIRGEDTE